MKDIIEMTLENMKRAKDFGFLSNEADKTTAEKTLTDMLDVEPELNQDILNMIEYINKEQSEL